MKLAHHRAPVPAAAKPSPCSRAFQSARLHRHGGHRCVRAWAEEESDEAFEKRLAALKKGGDTGGEEGEAKKKANKQAAAAPGTGGLKAKTPMQVDYSDETVWRELQPARSDLYFNIALGFTLVWLPLTASAVGRCLFVNYKITDKRVCVSTSSPWSKEESQVGMHEIARVTGVSRAFGLYGDMVISLTSGDKLELRSIPKWQEVRDYIVARRNAVRGSDISTAELMGESG